jgi:Cytochrome c554 and c-prime
MSARLRHLAAALLCASAAQAGGTPLPDESPRMSLGVGSCASSSCHGAAQSWKDSNVLQTEYHTWLRSDKHARAYAVLLNERSREIAAKLGLKEPAHRSAVCLDCHAHNVPAARREKEFSLADGVGCEACHGPAERWIRRHVEPKATHEANVADGLYPGAGVEQRARLCLSCHFGNARKFVSHRMMGAGHPRLSFELDTFTRMGPVHYRIDEDWQRRKGGWDGVSSWAVGQAVAAQELLRTLLDPARGRDGLFPELVLFDCHACHQPMANRRNKGRLPAGPGAVRLNDSSLLMLRHVAQRLDPAAGAGFGRQLGRLHLAIASGNDGAAEARATLQMVERLLPAIVARRFTTEDVRGMMTTLLDEGIAGNFTDYAGAEQATMALQSLASGLRQRGALPEGTAQASMKRLLETVSDDESFKAAAFQAALRELRTAIETGARR